MAANTPPDSHNQDFTEHYIDECRHPAIQRLKPQLSASDLTWTETSGLTLAAEIDNTGVDRDELIWLPQLDQLLSMLREKSSDPTKPLLRPCEEGWECIVTIVEWTADYGTFVETQRRFVGKALKLIVLRALKAATGAGERWMV